MDSLKEGTEPVQLLKPASQEEEEEEEEELALALRCWC